MFTNTTTIRQYFFKAYSLQEFVNQYSSPNGCVDRYTQIKNIDADEPVVLKTKYIRQFSKIIYANYDANGIPDIDGLLIDQSTFQTKYQPPEYWGIFDG